MCNQLNQRGPTLTSFKAHKEVPNEDAKYFGKRCNNQFKDKNRMELHRESFHEAVRYSYKMCD